MRLAVSVKRILKHENKQAKAKLKPRLTDITADIPFCSYPVSYLPGAGRGIFIGDIHGDTTSVLRVLQQEKFFQRVRQDDKLYLVMLGDYADRGKSQIKTLELLFNLKRYFPQNVVLLRGNHEEITMAQHYGLLGACIQQFGYDKGQYVLERINDTFEQLPGILVTGNGIAAVHGGVPVNPVDSLQSLNDEEELAEIRWNDPSEEVTKFSFNYRRGGHYLFGETVFNRFLESIGAQVMIRSHEYVAKGYKLHFHKRLLTIFSNGGTSPDSGYQDFILSPKYAVVDLSKPITRWNTKHIRTITYTS